MAIYLNEILKKQIKDKEYGSKVKNALVHDIKNHIVILDALIKEKKFDMLNNYINDLKITIQNTETRYLENVIVNAIINNKIQESNDNNINLKFCGNLKSNINISNLDLCSLIGNILDNAIAAVSKISNPNKRLIALNIKQNDNLIFIECKNYFNHTLQEKNNEFLSTKRNYLNYGYGTQIIKSIANKYNGTVKFKTNKDVFIVFVVLQI